MAKDARERLTALRNGLLRWHLKLLESEKAAYEREVARISTTGQYLNLVLNDTRFAWLRELSQFIVSVDETLDAKGALDAAAAGEIEARARALAGPAEDGAGFRGSLAKAILRDPDLKASCEEMAAVFAGLDG